MTKRELLEILEALPDDANMVFNHPELGHITLECMAVDTREDNAFNEDGSEMVKSFASFALEDSLTIDKEIEIRNSVIGKHRRVLDTQRQTIARLRGEPRTIVH